MCDKPKEEKTLDNLEAGDILNGRTQKHEVQLVNSTKIMCSPLSDGSNVYMYSTGYMKEKGWTIDKPLSKVEKGAKKMLELAGFKVTR